MPIGSSKLGVLGAGLVPGGSQTFNAPGTFSVPPGVKIVNITGKGGTGNPGNAGNPGNSGNVGNGGAGGGGGATAAPTNCPGLPFIGCLNSEGGGWAYKSGWPSIPGINSLAIPNPTPFSPWGPAGTAPPTYSPGIAIGASAIKSTNSGNVNPRNNAQCGSVGNSGTAGNSGNPGNTGNSSSAICKSFSGGAGGNAGVGGAGGTGGSAGGAGNSGGNFGGAGGTGGTGSGSGGSGINSPASPGQNINGASGGGGAGVTNSGSNGLNSNVTPAPTAGPFSNLYFSRGGDSPEFSANFNPGNRFNNQTQPQPPGAAPPNMTGGINLHNSITVAQSLQLGPACGPPVNISPNRDALSDYGSPNPVVTQSNIWRSGAGGGRSSSMSFNPIANNYQIGGGGGGGGRGGGAGAGGNSSAPSGSAATPQTFNSVPVTPGAPYPITVASPGGQVIISWNPQ